MTLLKTAVEVDPQNSDASYDLGKALLLQGDAEAAVPALLLRNQTKIAHWLRVKTIGTASSRDGFGARVRVKAGGLTQIAEVRGNSSLESASNPRLHFGLGSATNADSIAVHWPSGKMDTVGPESVDQELVLQEGHGLRSI